ncbi:hypothetical protein [Agrobacterium tumefaciens]|uniref:hypothetical protein n=1 Tax=Agrobacterium tumefaciens TaxID=358 RepID=UPI000459DC91|nr:hypothetical protein [Agrobacterium tumefaciens]CDN96064.1 hypothetical protein BN949_05238 [Agrobacterium tumefaciens]
MIALATIDKLGKLFPRLASDHDGEVVATARAIIRILEKSGASLHDLAGEMQPKVRVVDRVVYRDRPEPKKPKARKKAEPAPPPMPDRVKVDWEVVTKWAPHLVSECDLNEKETSFVAQVYQWAKLYKKKLTLTPRQADWWARILIENDVDIGAPSGGDE